MAETFLEITNRILLNNQPAIRFMVLICDVLHTWDDLRDRDRPVDDEQIHRAFYSSLIMLPQDNFYISNFNRLNPILEMAILNWQTANALEDDGSDYDLEIAFILRSSYSDLATMCARIVGGEAWARQVGPEIHRHWHSEGYATYKENLLAEKRARKNHVS